MKIFWLKFKKWIIATFGIGAALAAGLALSPSPVVTPPTNSYDCTQPIKFTVTNGDGYTYSDALTMPQAQCEALTDADIAQMEQDRFNNWINNINSHSGDFSPTIENIIDPLDTQNAQSLP